MGTGKKRILIDTGEGKSEYLEGLAAACEQGVGRGDEWGGEKSGGGENSGAARRVAARRVAGCLE